MPDTAWVLSHRPTTPNACGDRRRTPEDSTVRFVTEMVEDLWPPEDSNGVQRFLSLPSRRRPRLLVPAEPAKVSAAAVRALAADRALPALVRREVVANLLRVGGNKLFGHAGVIEAGSGGISTQLADVLGSPLHVGMLVGPPRANRKPVLVLLRPSGTRVGYAKIGSSAIARDLVETEAAALSSLASFETQTLLTPTLLHTGTWGGMNFAVQTPLDTRRARTAARSQLIRAASEVVASGSDCGSLTSCGAWHRAQARLDRASQSGSPLASPLSAARDQLESLVSSVVVPLGAWHGDWTPWNVAAAGERVLAWDWERYALGVPAGWDLLHYDLQYSVGVRGRSWRDAAMMMMHDAPALLEPFGTGGAWASAVAAAYLVEIGTRYLADGQAEAGHRAGRLDEWLLPTLRSALTDVRGAFVPG